VSDSSDAITREAAWLAAGTLSSYFKHIQAYPRVLPEKVSSLSLYRERIAETRESMGGRKLQTHHLVATVRWPLVSRAGQAEAELLALDVAVEALLARIRGPLGDKTHGGRFLSAGEDIEVDFPDPLEVLDSPDVGNARGGTGRLVVTVRYSADDELVA